MLDMDHFFIIFAICLSFANGKTVCRKPFGCFSDNYPFNDALTQLPQEIKDVGTLFRYHTKKTGLKNPKILDPLDHKSPSKENFNGSAPTVIFTHGYLESRVRWYVPMMIEHLLKYDENMNVIFVEWASGATFPYHQAYGNARLVGNQITEMIKVINNDTGIDIDKLRLVGFSLGSHIMGYVGRNLKGTKLALKRITALDPAAPYYEGKPPEARIDETDAEFVDVIHTDSKTLFVAGFGTVQPMGHVDFFPNGGYHQIGCGKVDIGVVQYLACSHYRSVRYWIESINSKGCPYYGYPCGSFKNFENKECTKCPDEGCPMMSYHIKPTKSLTSKGYKNSNSKKMNFYMITHDEFPFCAIHYEITFATHSGIFADLDDEVTVKLTGKKGTDTIQIEDHYYRAGEKERMLGLGHKDIGELVSVQISHSGLIDAWHLKGVAIRRYSSHDVYIACYNMWLNKINSERLEKKNDADDLDKC